MLNEINGRQVVFCSLVGSHNYNLNNKDSDRDYKYFTLPTFDDLYEGNYMSESVVGKEIDYTSHDIRKLPKLLYKANINFLEILFSKEIHINPNLEGELRALTECLFAHKHEIAEMNLRGLYEACIGTHNQKMKLLLKGTEGTQHLVDKYGYDTKQSLHAYRVLDFIERFYNNYFDFKDAMWYEGQDKVFLKHIREGSYTYEEFLRIANTKLEDITTIYKNRYYEYNVIDSHINEVMKELVKKIVKYSLI